MSQPPRQQRPPQPSRNYDDLPPGERFAAVPVSAFPFPHDPFRCPHHHRFCQFAEHSNEPEPVLGARWHLSLTSADLAACEFHAGDWHAVGAASIAVLDAAGPRATLDDLLSACEHQQLGDIERLWLFLLFEDPIAWIPSETEVTNGQHRLCALRAAGAKFVAADTLGHRPPEPQYDDARAAALAVISEAD